LDEGYLDGGIVGKASTTHVVVIARAREERIVRVLHQYLLRGRALALEAECFRDIGKRVLATALFGIDS
jgi:hypothetical protein